ncbi:MAG: folate-binding protein YgfZ [Caulobacterales bacterium]|jgi:folate-binding protein YgfZ|nr:folate-binding protein YgfZ [Caulobacterales bacterium]
MTGPTRLDRSLIRVSGPDARKFLNNVLTQELDKLERAPVVYAALLTPQGKVLADMFVWATPDGVLLDVDPYRAEDLFRRLSMYKLRADAKLEDVSAAHDVLAASDPFEGAARDPRLADLGWRKVVTKAAHGEDSGAYAARLLALGVPDLARDAGPDEVFAGEALLDELNGVDFQKGCFVGQENVSRMKRRATTRKKFCPIVFEGAPPPPGALVTTGAAELGAVRTGADARAMAFLRLDRALDAKEPLAAGGKEVRLAPPDWLILPGAAGTPD